MRQASFILLFTLFCVFESIGQPVFTPRNMAFGGGGSTYITNYQANFYNPANLMIQAREGRFSIGAGIGGVYFKGLKNYNGFNRQLKNLKDHLTPFNNDLDPLSNEEKLDIANDNYPGRKTVSTNKYRYEATLFGFKWMTDNRAFSVALRTRTSTIFNVGRGWYAGTFTESPDEKQILDRTLTQRYQNLHEISFGYAESFKFLTNLTSRLDNFVIGIAPKLVLGSDYQNADWQNNYQKQDESDLTTQIEVVRYNAAGEFAAADLNYFLDIPLSGGNSNAFTNTSFDINGIGAGLDIGITYLISLGSDLSAVQLNQQPTRRSLRLSFSMTDIGFISYNKKSIGFDTPVDTTFNTPPPTKIANQLFTGAKGQYFDFIQQFSNDDPFSGSPYDQGTFSALLPMALHGGALLEMNRVKLMGDMSVGLTNNAFNTTRLTSSFGIELRPFSFMPVRGGIRLEAQRPEFVSLGTAIETTNWDLSLAGIFAPNSINEKPSITGAAAATLQFYF